MYENVVYVEGTEDEVIFWKRLICQNEKIIRDLGEMTVISLRDSFRRHGTEKDYEGMGGTEANVRKICYIESELERK